MAPSLRLRSGNLCEGLSEGLPPPPSSHPQSADQTAQVRSGAGNGQQMVWHNQTRIRDVEIKVFSDWFQWLEMNCLNILTRLEASRASEILSTNGWLFIEILLENSNENWLKIHTTHWHILTPVREASSLPFWWKWTHKKTIYCCISQKRNVEKELSNVSGCSGQVASK